VNTRSGTSNDSVSVCATPARLCRLRRAMGLARVEYEAAMLDRQPADALHAAVQQAHIARAAGLQEPLAEAPLLQSLARQAFAEPAHAVHALVEAAAGSVRYKGCADALRLARN